MHWINCAALSSTRASGFFVKNQSAKRILHDWEISPISFRQKTKVVSNGPVLQVTSNSLDSCLKEEPRIAALLSSTASSTRGWIRYSLGPSSPNPIPRPKLVGFCPDGPISRAQPQRLLDRFWIEHVGKEAEVATQTALQRQRLTGQNCVSVKE